MRKKLKGLLEPLTPSRFTPAFLLVLGLKTCFFLALCLRIGHHGYEGFWGGITYDTGTYLEPIENLLSSGTYSPDFRLPGYGAPYLALRSILPRPGALNVIILLQLLLDAIATVLLARLAYRGTGSVGLFRSVLLLASISLFVSLYDVLALTESFTASACVIGAWAFLRAIDGRHRGFAALAGACFIWAAFLRPVMMPVVGIPILLLFFFKGIEPRARLKLAVFFLLPVVLIEGSWVIRNHNAHGRFMPLSSSWLMPDLVSSPSYRMCEVVQCFGGSLMWWDPEAEVRAFGVADASEPEWKLQAGLTPAIPDHATTEAFPLSRLSAMADSVRVWRLMPEDAPERQRLGHFILTEGNAYKQDYRTSRPWQYQVMARARLLKKLLIHSGTYMDLPQPEGLLEHLGKGFYSLIYWFCLVGGVSGCFILLFARHRPTHLLLALLTLGYGVLVHAWMLRFTDYRYLVPFYPWALLLACWAVHHIAGRRSSRAAHSSTVAT